ncbi:hypothetical protein SUGI_0497320 [Cryptomeria japonica]|uniref:uncharacterized protein LOC131063140 n=1 Tax=Cryptomeria japonica TaxID=3369 RepID=UPI002408E8ED|nr:uncharacterized protein LOC131063140 [Cryptomeria japonica]GLJ25943.1 hypothetical protein SUGI_0497320 [Cryptomeria japonica]
MGEKSAWVESHLDIVLVPAGFLMLVIYHGCLLHKILTHPQATFVGINTIHRQAWVQAIMKDGMKNGVLAVQTIRNGIMASTLLASTAITLCSVVGLLVGMGGSPNELTFYGMTGPLTSSVKFLVLLGCLLVAFLCHVQCVRYYSDVSFLIITPPASPEMEDFHVEYVSSMFKKGAYFWSVGLRAFYLCVPLFLWNFGPIPMFVASCLLLVFLHSLDRPGEDLSAVHDIKSSKRTKKIGHLPFMHRDVS